MLSECTGARLTLARDTKKFSSSVHSSGRNLAEWTELFKFPISTVLGSLVTLIVMVCDYCSRIKSIPGCSSTIDEVFNTQKKSSQFELTGFGRTDWIFQNRLLSGLVSSGEQDRWDNHIESVCYWWIWPANNVRWFRTGRECGIVKICNSETF